MIGNCNVCVHIVQFWSVIKIIKRKKQQTKSRWFKFSCNVWNLLNEFLMFYCRNINLLKNKTLMIMH